MVIDFEVITSRACVGSPPSMNGVQPIKHEALTQCCVNIGPASATLS